MESSHWIYALQDDKRFDEVGPAGQGIVVFVSPWTRCGSRSSILSRYLEIEYDRNCYSSNDRARKTLDDELSQADASGSGWRKRSDSINDLPSLTRWYVTAFAAYP